MFDIDLTLTEYEANVLSENIKDSMNCLIDYFSSASDEEIPKSAFSLSVLAKLYNVLPKEKVDPATNDIDQFSNY